jgi:hypothetical protein
MSPEFKHQSHQKKQKTELKEGTINQSIGGAERSMTELSKMKKKKEEKEDDLLDLRTNLKLQ